MDKAIVYCVRMTVTIKHLYISPDNNYYGDEEEGSPDHVMIERTSIDLKAGEGIENDYFLGAEEAHHGQITFFDWEVFKTVRDEIVKGDLRPSNFQRNIFIEGMDLHKLIGKRFLIGGVEFMGQCETSPSPWMDEECADGVHDSLKKRAGIIRSILNDGRLDCGNYELEVLG